MYRHFPDETALFSACSAHWLAQQQPPDPGAWAQIADPVERLRAGLADLYRFYRAGAAMLSRVHRDVAALPEAHQRRLREQADGYCGLLTAPFGERLAPGAGSAPSSAMPSRSGPGTPCARSRA